MKRNSPKSPTPKEVLDKIWKNLQEGKSNEFPEGDFPSEGAIAAAQYLKEYQEEQAIREREMLDMIVRG